MLRKFINVCQVDLDQIEIETGFKTRNRLLPPLSGISLTNMLRTLPNINK
jgi:hypothetical protein